MALGTGTNWPTAVDADANLGPTSGIIPGVTHLGDTGTGQGDILGITKNMIKTHIAIENYGQCGNFWCATNGTYVQPAIGSTVTVTVYATPYGTAQFQQGMTVNVQPGIPGGNIGGLYLVTFVTSNTSLTLLNLGGPQNVASSTVIPTSSIIQIIAFGNEGLTDSVGLYEREWDHGEKFTSGSNPTAEWTVTLNNSGTFASDNTAADATALNMPSLWLGSTAPATNSSFIVAPQNIFIPSLTPLDLSFSLAFPNLSTNTNQFSFFAGVSTSATSATPGSVTCMGIGYNQAASVNWNVYTGTTTTSNPTSTGVAVVAATLYHIRMTLNSGWTSLTAYINHANATTVTANLQTGQMFVNFIMVGIAGTANKTVQWGRTKLRLYLPR